MPSCLHPFCRSSAAMWLSLQTCANDAFGQPSLVTWIQCADCGCICYESSKMQVCNVSLSPQEPAVRSYRLPNFTVMAASSDCERSCRKHHGAVLHASVVCQGQVLNGWAAVWLGNQSKIVRGCKL